MITGAAVLNLIESNELFFNYGLLGIIIVILLRFVDKLLKKQDERERLLVELIEKKFKIR